MAGIAQSIDWLYREVDIYKPAVLAEGIGRAIVELTKHRPELLADDAAAKRVERKLRAQGLEALWSKRLK